MKYFLLSVWKENGDKSYSLCCSTSDKQNDLLHNMGLYKINDDEIYVMALCENGTEKYQGGIVSRIQCYNHNRQVIDVNNLVQETIINALNEVLALEI